MLLERKCTLWVHDEIFSKEPTIINTKIFDSIHPDDLLSVSPIGTETYSHEISENSSTQGPRKLNGMNTEHSLNLGTRYLFFARTTPEVAIPGLEISVSKNVADTFGFKHRSNVIVTTANIKTSTASHIELSFKDECLTRCDIWRLTLSELSKKVVFKGQKLIFMGCIKAQVISIYLNGQKVKSAFFSSSTVPIFRSGSARYFLLIQMSKEMWEFDSEGTGEIMFNKVINGFLPTLFKKWAALKSEHLVSIILFTRVEYGTDITTGLVSDVLGDTYFTGIECCGNKRPYKDFYRVVVYEMVSGSWTTILYQLKREFNHFRRDISMHHINFIKSRSIATPEKYDFGSIGSHFEAQASLAMYGNILEAIDLTCYHFASEHIDQDFIRTGNSIVIITPCAGLFEVDHDTLKMTSEMLVSNRISVDLVCLPRMPLHSAPLFRYKNPEHIRYIKYLKLDILDNDNTPQAHSGLIGSLSTTQNSVSTIKSLSTSKNLPGGSSIPSKIPNEWLYSIPYWLNISFWTGPSHNVKNLKFSAQLKLKNIGDIFPSRPTDFAVRCKMYEIEMAGIIESVFTEISVAPLNHDPLFPEKKAEISHKQPNIIERKFPYAGLSELISISSKLYKEEDFPQFIYDTYDLMNSCVSDESLTSSLKIIKKPQGYAGDKFPKNHRQGSLGADLGTNSNFSNRISKISGKSPRKIKSRYFSRLELDGKEKNRHTTSSITKNPDSHPIPTGSSKTSRQISLGKYGFGITASKVAAVEIHTENANAIRSSSNLSSAKGIEFKSIIGYISNSIRNTPKSTTSKRKPIDREILNLVPDKSMTIKSTLESLDSTNQAQSQSILGSNREWSNLIMGSVPKNSIKFSPDNSLSPWLNIKNPSNSGMKDEMNSGQYKRCHSVMANSRLIETMKWKSLCFPASLTLTTEYFPTKNELETEFEQKPYKISQNTEDEYGNEIPRNREELLRELIGLRLSQGFQIIVSPLVAEAFGQKALKTINIFELNKTIEDGISIFMSMGNVIHQISYVNDGEFEINIFFRKLTRLNTRTEGLVYHPAIRTKLSQYYESQPITLGKRKEHYNWNYVDTFLGGFDEEISESLYFYRARFVLIPVDRPSQALMSVSEDNEEEVRLEGIKKLTQLWQRHRVTLSSEVGSRDMKKSRSKDPNPLDIVYKTEDPSLVVTAELETLSIIEMGDNGLWKSQLFETERFRKSNLDIAELAEAIQAPVDKGGVRMQNRRWHLRLYYNCFIGSDMTTWLIDNFEDIETREKAVEFGNRLMARHELLKSNEKEKEKEKYIGLFVHVDSRHKFRDGQYFYQIADEFIRQGTESRSTWFASKKQDFHLPSTSAGENILKDSTGLVNFRSSLSVERISESDKTNSKILSNPRKPKLTLSKVMKYDVDYRRRSIGPEIINLHYDRLHNPDNCYHIRIDWLCVTTRLIKDAIESWTLIADPYGLKLVEVPIAEVCSINLVNPFQNPYRIKIQLPPSQQPKACMKINSLLSQPLSSLDSTIRYKYQKAILKKFNFVLDTEAATSFPSNVDVTYSWGKPNYKFSQYIHRSGIVLAQITDDNYILLLTNHLLYNRPVPFKEEIELYTPQKIMNELENFFLDAKALETIYKEVIGRSAKLNIFSNLSSEKTKNSIPNDPSILSQILQPDTLAEDNSSTPSLHDRKIEILESSEVRIPFDIIKQNPNTT
ncbi:hypothetical protein EPUL_002045 [Erysiphe pulchra]|uniref:Vacuolar membrane-associated protein IML1 n=1 Tax=Erysiphe pulchra TaxID=225359 RepID=A0A2S4PT93_9PEZI|nr:hypothetical protein EPUL_002045 [Erysiphe pulchra]